MTRPYRIVFRPAIPLAEARRILAAALDDEGLRLATVTHGARPYLWATLDRGALTVYLDPRGVVAKEAVQ